MKKIVVLLLAVVMVLSVVAFAACTQPEPEKVTGEFSYSSTWGTYGAKVDVTVTGNKITAVKLYSDEETGWTNLTSSWDGKQVWLDGGDAYVQSFVGKTVDEVKGYAPNLKADSTVANIGGKGENAISTSDAFGDFAGSIVTGASQSSARVLLAIQNALSKLSK